MTPEALEAVARLYAAYPGRSVPAATLELVAEALSDVPSTVRDDAIGALQRTFGSPPSLAQVLEAVSIATPQPAPRALTPPEVAQTPEAEQQAREWVQRMLGPYWAKAGEERRQTAALRAAAAKGDKAARHEAARRLVKQQLISEGKWDEA